MDTPVSEQMNRLKEKIQSFRQMLSTSSILDSSFEDGNQSDSFISPESLRYHQLLEKYTQPETNANHFFNRKSQNAPSFRKQQDVRSLLQNNGIKNISRGYHYSNSKQIQRPKAQKKPILFIRPDTSSSDYDTDESDDYQYQNYSRRHHYDLSNELSSESTDNTFTHSRIESNDSEYEEAEEESESDYDPKSFSYLNFTIKKQQQIDSQKRQKKRNQHKQKAMYTKKNPVKTLARLNLNESTESDTDSGDSLVDGLIRNAENLGFLTPSKINSSDEVILVNKPILPHEKKETLVNSPIKVGKEFDQLINKLATIDLNKKEDSDEEVLNDYEEEIPDLQGIIQRAKDSDFLPSSSTINQSQRNGDEIDIPNLSDLSKLDSKENTSLNNNNDIREKVASFQKQIDNLNDSDDGIAQTKQNLSKILMGLNLDDDSDEHTETDSSINLEGIEHILSDISDSSDDKPYAPVVKGIQQHLKKPIPGTDHTSEASYNSSGSFDFQDGK